MNIRAYFARHAQVMVGSLGRITQQPTATLMTMAVIAVALALPLFLYLFLQNARTATANWNDAYNLSVYMDKKAGAVRVSALAKQLQKRGDIATVRIITADQALAAFRKDSGFGSALDALTDNPLPDTLIVTPTLTASTPQGTDALKAAIASLPDVQTVQLDTEWVRRLYAMLDLLRTVLFLTCGLLGLGVVLIVSNTIRLDILNRRAEIEVKKLVGASDRFARRPFLYSGHLVRAGRGCPGPDTGRDRILGAGSTGRSAGPVVRQRVQARGAGIAHQRQCYWRGRGTVLGGFLACCNAAYPSNRTDISICF